MTKVEIESCKLIDNTYSTNGKIWSALTLIEAAKDLEPFDLPLAGINLSNMAWNGMDNMYGFLYQAKRVQEVDLKYPIILSNTGAICDGWHRVCKAILEGRETIKAVRLKEMPIADSTYEETK